MGHSSCPLFQQLKCARRYTAPPMEAWLEQLLILLALPKFGLSTVFTVAFISATLLPLGSEPVVFGLVELNPALFWPAIGVATLGNTLGGMVTWAMGLGMGLAACGVALVLRASGAQASPRIPAPKV